MSQCKNCGQKLVAGGGWCPACGQKVDSLVRPLQSLVSDFASEAFDLDGKAWRSLRALLFRPGFLTREYLDGRRQQWTSPIRIYLVISLLFFLVLPLIFPEMDSTEQAAGTGVADPARRPDVDAYSQAMFLLLPVFALLIKLFYRAEMYAAHLVFAVHGFSAMFIAFGIMLAFESLANAHLYAVILQLAVFAYMLGYSVVALRVVYDESWTKTILKFCALFILFLPLISATINLAIWVSEWLGLGLQD